MPFKGELYPFQEEAKQRMLQRRAFMLAMDLGAGKTITTIAVTEQLLDEQKVAGVLIVCDDSIKYQWRSQIYEWAGEQVSVAVVDGPFKRRKEIYQAILAEEFDYAIINYAQVVNDWEYVCKLPRDVLVCDEVTRIKGFAAQRSKKIKKLMSPYRFGLTGQPVENRADEVFSVMQWIDPNLLGGWNLFDRTFIKRQANGRIMRYRNLPLLHKRLKQRMLRKSRWDPDVQAQFPKLSRESLLIDMDLGSAALYGHISEKLLGWIDEAGADYGNFDLASYYEGDNTSGDTVHGEIMARVTALRQLCAHPEVLRRAQGNYAKRLQASGRLEGLDKSAKLDATMDLLGEILSADKRNKIVLFSGWINMLPVIEAEVARRKLPTTVVKFQAHLNAEQRDRVVKRFASDSECRLFLSNDCGGYGLDLPMANYLISYDHPWSAGTWRQRNGRIDRVASKFGMVTLLDTQLVGTLDEWQYEMLEQKLRIGQAIVDGSGHTETGEVELTLSALGEFIRAHPVG